MSDYLISKKPRATERSISVSAPTSASATVTIYSDLNVVDSQTAEHRRHINDAIYAHIESVRALGRDRINTVEIARALKLPLRDVERAIGELVKMGVDIKHGGESKRPR